MCVRSRADCAACSRRSTLNSAKAIALCRAIGARYNMNAQIGNRLNRHTVFALSLVGVDAYAFAYGDCSTVTAHATATAALRENGARATASKLTKSDKVIVCGLTADGKIVSGLSYVRAFALSGLDSKSDCYSRQIGNVSVRGSFVALKKVCGKANAQIVSTDTAKKWIGAIIAGKTACLVWQSVGVNRNGKSVALACDDCADAKLIEDKRAK